MKKTYFLKLMLLAIVMFAGSGYAMADKWVKIDNHTDVTETDTYLIVEVNSKTALTSEKGTASAPTVVSVPLVGNTIEGEIGDVLKWKFKTATGGYTIHVASDESKWLYSTNTNNGVRVGTNADNVFELNITDVEKPNYKGFKHISTTRFLGVYNNQDWRTYTPIHANIADSQIEIFKLDTSVPTTPTITAAGAVDFKTSINAPTSQTINIGGTNLTGNITISGATAPFSVSPASLGTAGGEITITYSPTSAGTHTANLTLSSPGAENKIIGLTGEAFATQGNGTEADPFTVADVILLNNSLTNAGKLWVKGYIVAAQAASGGGTLTPLQSNFAEDAAATAILLADNANETELENMTPVQLPAGTSARTNLNLKDNPQNFMKAASVEGNLSAYFGQTPGIRNVENYKLGTTSVLKNNATAHVFTTAGQIHVDATAGEQIAVYNVAGQQLASRLATDGINTISLNAKGVVIVKVADRVGKVILK